MCSIDPMEVHSVSMCVCVCVSATLLTVFCWNSEGLGVPVKGNTIKNTFSGG